jgi:hypothetical protein
MLRFCRNRLGEKAPFKWWFKYMIADWHLRCWLEYEGMQKDTYILSTTINKAEGLIICYIKKGDK